MDEAFGSRSAAESSKRRVTLFRSAPPPASDINTTARPAGLTSSRSMSSGKEWLRLESVTVTLLTTPGRPETMMVEGYGVAAAPSLIVMELVLRKRTPLAWARTRPGIAASNAPNHSALHPGLGHARLTVFFRVPTWTVSKIDQRRPGRAGQGASTRSR